MIEPRAIVIARSLTRGVGLALMGMTDEWSLPTTMTYRASGAHLLWRDHNQYNIVERQYVKVRSRQRTMYRLTPLGLQVQRAFKEKK